MSCNNYLGKTHGHKSVRCCTDKHNIAQTDHSTWPKRKVTRCLKNWYFTILCFDWWFLLLHTLLWWVNGLCNCLLTNKREKMIFTFQTEPCLSYSINSVKWKSSVKKLVWKSNYYGFKKIKVEVLKWEDNFGCQSTFCQTLFHAKLVSTE